MTRSCCTQKDWVIQIIALQNQHLFGQFQEALNQAMAAQTSALNQAMAAQTPALNQELTAR